ncbi:hypothetical protein ANCDUO_17951 [Ancylostoma duodenale]|uniref:Uncharacterized protein n=1 Tax=Ancylostoma duodenale TaxID=51022 RepID=A0A0C2FZ61_9BILA|nr:hypothetical protein ANCDUO_17951 [Ancylostoma duodenale]
MRDENAAIGTTHFNQMCNQDTGQRIGVGDIADKLQDSVRFTVSAETKSTESASIWTYQAGGQKNEKKRWPDTIHADLR